MGLPGNPEQEPPWKAGHKEPPGQLHWEWWGRGDEEKQGQDQSGAGGIMFAGGEQYRGSVLVKIHSRCGILPGKILRGQGCQRNKMMGK